MTEDTLEGLRAENLRLKADVEMMTNLLNGSRSLCEGYRSRALAAERALGTEQEMHNAWRKRAEHAESVYEKVTNKLANECVRSMKYQGITDEALAHMEKGHWPAALRTLREAIPLRVRGPDV